MKVTEVEGISEYQLENGEILFPDASKEVVTVNKLSAPYEGCKRWHTYWNTCFQGHTIESDIPKATKGGAGRSIMERRGWIVHYYEIRHG